MAHRKRIAVVTKHLAGGQAASSLFNGSVTIITGAGRGIGREAALLFAMNGARLVLNDLDRWANKNISSPRFASRTLLVLTANGTSPSYPPQFHLSRSVCEAVCEEVRDLGAEAVGVHGDLTKPGVVEALVDAAVRRFSGIDIIVNNA